MKTKEEQLAWHNKIAATIGTEQTIAVLKDFLESARADMATYVPTNADPHGFNLHRLQGRAEMLEHLIKTGQRHNKPITTKEQSK